MTGYDGVVWWDVRDLLFAFRGEIKTGVVSNWFMARRSINIVSSLHIHDTGTVSDTVLWNTMTTACHFASLTSFFRHYEQAFPQQQLVKVLGNYLGRKSKCHNNMTRRKTNTLHWRYVFYKALHIYVKVVRVWSTHEITSLFIPCWYYVSHPTLCTPYNLHCPPRWEMRNCC